MKLHPDILYARGKSGILLIECVVYIAVFFIMLGGAMTVFYFCWNHSEALVYATDDISSALRAGERWRADVRGATGKIIIETNSTGEMIRIPEGQKEILYRFESGEMRRQVASSNFSELLLPKVKTSQMKIDARSEITAWRWELELVQRRKETYLPLLFTFEAVTPIKP
jgi:hypothetical protein